MAWHCQPSWAIHRTDLGEFSTLGLKKPEFISSTVFKPKVEHRAFKPFPAGFKPRFESGDAIF